MGNSIGRSRKAKVMKIDGETFRVKIPTTSNDVVKDYPNHVLLDSQAVKHFGLRAKPLEPNQELKPKKIYFLVELPKIEEKTALPRRVRSSGISTMNAKDRLELLMLSKRSVSDLTLVRPSPNMGFDGPMRVKMRLPKAQLDKLMEESNDGAEVAEKIMSLYMLETQTADTAEEDDVHRQNGKQRVVSRYLTNIPLENNIQILYYYMCTQLNANTRRLLNNATLKRVFGYVDFAYSNTQRRVSFSPMENEEIIVESAPQKLLSQ